MTTDSPGNTQHRYAVESPEVDDSAAMRSLLEERSRTCRATYTSE